MPAKHQHTHQHTPRHHPPHPPNTLHHPLHCALPTQLQGRIGRLIGVSEASGKGVVRVDVGRRTTDQSRYEVKVLDLSNLAKALPDAPQDSQFRWLTTEMCPGGLFNGCRGAMR